MNPLAMIDPEIDAEQFGDQYVITIETDYGTVSIEVETWVADMALSQAREAVEDASDEYRELFEKVEVALND